MNRYLFVLIIILHSFFSPQNVLCYEMPTHPDITEAALKKSLTKKNFLRDIGYNSEEDKITYTSDGSSVSGINGTTNQSILEWIRLGSKDEDESNEGFLRYRNHFYDPVNKIGYHYWGASGETAPDWILEDKTTYSSQKWSLKDAKTYYLTALTSSTKKERDNNFAKTFKALGHVLHLVEDMAQPQHTRNDSHGGTL